MKTKKHRWVFEIKGCPGAYATNWGPVDTRGITTDLKQAVRVGTRDIGRCFKHKDEVLRKVEINENYVNVKILPGR